MATPRWIHFREFRTGANDPDGNSDVFNRPARAIWKNFRMQHDRDGDHKSDLKSHLWRFEAFTYAGNGADNHAISLTNTTIEIQFLRIFADGVLAGTAFRTKGFPGDLTFTTAETIPAEAGMVKSLGTGSFVLGDSVLTNGSGVTYHGLAYGV